MKILIMGTAAAEGIPAVFCNCPTCKKAKALGDKDIRTRQQALIDDKLLIDFGADTYCHFLKEKRSLYDIENILFTHSHYDHFYRDDFFNREYGYAYEVTSPKLNFYCNDKIKNMMVEMFPKELLEQYYNFIVVNNYETYKVDEYFVTPFTANHAFDEDAHIYLIEKDGKAILYCLDTGVIKDDTMYDWLVKNNKYIDLVLFDCTKGATSRDYYTHMSMDENVFIKEKLLNSGICDGKSKFVSTHFSHNCNMNHSELEKEGEKRGLTIAFDGMVLTTD